VIYSNIKTSFVKFVKDLLQMDLVSVASLPYTARGALLDCVSGDRARSKSRAV
jgi:hypothetical protein